MLSPSAFLAFTAMSQLLVNGQMTVQPYYSNFPQDQSLFFQNNGYAFYPQNERNLGWRELNQLQAENAWRYQNNLIQSVQYPGSCLAMSQQGMFSMSSCSNANQWGWNDRGYLYDMQYRKMIGMQNERFIVRDYNDNVWDPSMLWSQWAVNNQAPPAMVPYTQQLHPAIPFSFRSYSDNYYMSINRQSNNYRLGVTEQPSPYQQQDWFYDNGMLRNAIYGQCLNAYASTNSLGLGPCDATASLWDYNNNARIIMEQKIKKAIAYENNAYSLVDCNQYQGNNYPSYMQWQPYASPMRMSSQGSSKSNSQKLVSSYITPVLLSASASMCFLI